MADTTRFVTQRTFWSVVAVILAVFGFFFGQLDILKGDMYTEFVQIRERLASIEAIMKR